MRKSFYYSILIFVFSMVVGFYYSVQWKKEHVKVGKEDMLNEVVQETSFKEEKLSFNTEFAIKKTYTKCGHSMTYYSEIPVEFINLNKEEIEENYPNWKVEEFNKDRLILSQEVDTMCDNHFVIKSNDDIVNVYYQKENNNLELYRQTGIAMEYLSEEDIKRLEQGIYIYGRENLISTLEDFE